MVYTQNSYAQLLPHWMDIASLQCKNYQYRYLWQYPLEMSDFFFLTSIYQTGWLSKQFIIVRSADHLVLIPGGFYYRRDASSSISRKQIWRSRQKYHAWQNWTWLDLTGLGWTWLDLSGLDLEFFTAFSGLFPNYKQVGHPSQRIVLLRFRDLRRPSSTYSFGDIAVFIKRVCQIITQIAEFLICTPCKEMPSGKSCDSQQQM